VYRKPVDVAGQVHPPDPIGRVNQKRRTRNAIVAAAQAIVERGETPTVARAANDAEVSRTTAYRYFPTQESLVLELAVTIDVREVEELVAQPLDGTTPQDRLLEFVDLFNRHALANERLYRTGTRHYMDMWLAADRLGEDHPYTREGRRADMIATILEPLRVTMPEAKFRRIQAALCLVAGGEAIQVLRDVCRLEAQEALAVTHWAADAILSAGLQQHDVPAQRRA
jgi:AcrR family transcriptional regulator